MAAQLTQTQASNAIQPTVSKIPGLLFMAWVVYVILYLILRGDNLLTPYVGSIVAILETSLDFIIVYYAIWLWKHSAIEFKRIFGFFALTFFLVAFAVGFYHLIFNVFALKISYFSDDNLYILMLNVPYALCLTFSLAAWFGIVFLGKKKLRKIFSYVSSFLILTLIIMLLAIFLQWKIGGWFVGKKSLFEVIIISLHLIIFILTTIGLTLSRNKGLFYLSVGFLLIIGVDLILDFGTFSKTLGMGSLLETNWFLEELFILYSLLYFKRTDSYKASAATWISASDSIRAQCALWSFIMCLGVLGVLLFISYLASPTNFVLDRNLIRSIPSLLIAAAFFFATISYFFASRLSRPVRHLENLITVFKEEQVSLPKVYDEYACKISELRYIENYLVESFRAFGEKREAERALFNSAVQVAHDIRSPLTALQVILKLISDVKEEYRVVISNATTRINDIANNLLVKYRNPDCVRQDFLKETKTDELIVGLLDSICSEKRVQYLNKNMNLRLEIIDNARNLFAVIDAGDFKRVLSNLIDNACEAIDHSHGEVILKLSSEGDNAILSVKDNGKGMSDNLCASLGKEKIVCSKKGGNGIGVFNAVSSIHHWGGSYHIQSEINEGTTFTIKLPKGNIPSWFQEKIELAENMQVIILDDDDSIHNIWKVRFKDCIAYGISLRHFYKAQELVNYLQQSELEVALQNSYYLLDYELLDSAETGLDLVRKFNLTQQDKATLVTSYYANHEIRRRCYELGVRIIPKNFAPYVKLFI